VRRQYDIRERMDCRTCFNDVQVIRTYTIR
jgi:hypothetical protein